MFSGRHDNPATIDEEDGSYFIDRDGRHFHHVLNFLRHGYVVSLPDADAARAELAAEADFYGLEELSRAIQQPQVDILSHLSPVVLTIREEEDKLRRAYSNRQAGLFEATHGLISLFGGSASRVVNSICTSPPIPYEEQAIKDTDHLCLTLRDNSSMSNGQVLATCESITEFKIFFNGHHPNILRRLRHVLSNKNIIIAGGSVLQALSSGENSRTKGWWGDESDVDLFIYGVDVFRANAIAWQVYDALAVNGEKWGVCRSSGVINFHKQDDDGCIVQKVQIILRIYDSPAEVLLGFDVDCCCCAFDGRDVWLTQRCLLALRTGTNILNPIHATPTAASYELRLAKYAKRGYAVLIPGLDKSRVDFTRILPADLGSLKGLARLLKVSQELESQATSVILSTFDKGVVEPLTKEMHLVPALAKEMVNCRDGAELLTSGHGWYNELGLDVIIPSIILSVLFPTGAMWYDYHCDFPVSDDQTRSDAWNDILDCEIAPGALPRYLSEAWDTSKRSREYLNAEIDSFDLNSIYYSEAYRK